MLKQVDDTISDTHTQEHKLCERIINCRFILCIAMFVYFIYLTFHVNCGRFNNGPMGLTCVKGIVFNRNGTYTGPYPSYCSKAERTSYHR